MKNYLQYIDCFNIRFHLYTKNQPRFRNAFGGIMSFIFFLICIILFLFISYEDLYKLNPITSKSEISISDTKLVNINKEKIYIPFRMVTYQEQFVDHRGILHILPYLVEGKYNNKTGMNLNYHLLNYTLCNETSMANKTQDYKIDIKLNELFCVDKDDIPFGGSWNGEFINYIEINLHLCKEGVDSNISDPRCTKLEELLKNKNNSWIFEFFYPIVQFQPTNIESPLAVIYRSYFYRLSTHASKVERIYLQENILSDDRSLIRSKSRNSSCWGTSNIYGDDYLLNNEIDNRNTSSRIYSLAIYMDNGYIYYTRTYKKLILIISNILPLVKIVLYFMKKFTQHIKMAFIRRDLAGIIFENKMKSINANIKLKNIKNIFNESMNKILILNRKDNQNDIPKSENINDKLLERKSKEIFLNNNSQNISLNSDNAINILNKREILMISSKKNSNSLKEPLKKEYFPKRMNKFEKKVFSKRKKFIFSYHYFFLDFFFDKLINPQKFCFTPRAYFIVYNFMCRIYDISNYIVLIRQFNLINNLIKKQYGPENIGYSKEFKKINVSDNNIIRKINDELTNEKSIIFSKYL